MDVRKELFIGGRFDAPSGSETIDVVCPSTENAVGQIPAGGTADMDRAVSAAREAFDQGPWPWMPVADRAAAMQRIVANLWPRVEEIATTITSEMGAAITQTRAGQASAPIAMLEYYAGLAGQVPLRETRAGLWSTATIVAEPVGVVAGVVPWNGPLWLAMFKLAPAL